MENSSHEEPKDREKVPTIEADENISFQNYYFLLRAAETDTDTDVASDVASSVVANVLTKSDYSDSLILLLCFKSM